MKLIKYSSVGLAIGFLFTTFYMILFTGFNEITKQILAWCIASALYGLSSLIYEIKSLKMLYAAILHYFVCFLITGVNISLFYREYLISALISFTLAYIMIYIIIWFYERECIKKLNKKLSK